MNKRAPRKTLAILLLLMLSSHASFSFAKGAAGHGAHGHPVTHGHLARPQPCPVGSRACR